MFAVQFEEVRVNKFAVCYIDQVNKYCLRGLDPFYIVTYYTKMGQDFLDVQYKLYTLYRGNT